MDTKQIKAMEWMDSLEQYAKDKRLSMRILDGIEECKKKMSKENSDWKDINLKVEDLLDSIGQKTVPALMQNQKEDQVSIQMVEEQIRRMAQRCQSENQASIGNISERKSLVIKKTYDDMREITHVKAHLEEMKEENLYLQFFGRVKSEYEKSAFQMLRELLQDISSNYDHLLEHLKNMLQSIGSYKAGVGNEKFYYEYESKREGLNNRLQSEAEQSDVGGNEITTFGQKTAETIRKIVKKMTVKRKSLAWIPLLILLLGLVIGAVITQGENQKVIESVQTDNAEGEGLPAWAKDAAKQIGAKVIENASTTAIANFFSAITTFAMALLISLGSFLLFIFLLIIVLYAVYLQILRTWCNHQICKECGKYLEKELDSFQQSQTLMPKLNAAVKETVEEYEQEYLTILNQIFSGTGFGSESDEQKEINQFVELRDTWNKIKYE